NRVQNKDALKKEIEQITMQKNLNEMIQELEENKIANAQLKDMKQFANHEQLESRKRWMNVQTPAGDIQSLLPPTAKSEEEINNSAIPEIGEHTSKILEELNISESKIAKLRDNKII